jgi:hypothetical protein
MNCDAQHAQNKTFNTVGSANLHLQNVVFLMAKELAPVAKFIVPDWCI